MTWPPADTFRHRFLYGLAAGIAALVAVYFLLFALQTRGFLPWVIFTVALAATLVAALGLALMRASRAAADAAGTGAATATQDRPAGTDPPPSRHAG